MIKNLFSVYDKKAGVYSNPFTQITPAAALRDFGQATNDPESLLYSNPEDFDLYHLGQFEDESGKFDLLQNPVFLDNAAFYRKFDAI